MFNRFSIRNLSIILLALVVVAGLVYLRDHQQGMRNFKDTLVSFQPSEVSALSIYPQQQRDGIHFLKKEGSWIIQQEGSILQADSAKLSSLIQGFSLIKPQRLAATSSTKWGDFSVDDTTGTRLSFFSGNHQLAEVIVGKFSFNQTTRTGITYFRIKDEKEVYAVEGYLSMEVNHPLEHWVKEVALPIEDELIHPMNIESD